MSDINAEYRERCWIDLMALAGGDESHVFLDMMVVMYSLWAYNHHRPFRMVRPGKGPDGRPTGRASLLIENVAWEWLAARENGVHRMIRIPPGQVQRHMSFVGVRVSGSADTPLPASPADWGEQIRSLIVNPEPALKNHRTGFVCTDIVGVMAGDLEQLWEERA